MMSLLEIIAELEKEKHILDEAIQALNRLAEIKVVRRGRPPQWMKDAIVKGNRSKDGDKTPPKKASE